MAADQAFWIAFVAVLAWAIWYGEILHDGFREFVIALLFLVPASFVLAIPIRYLLQAFR